MENLYMEPSTAQKTAYLPTLDGWRAIAISLVLIAHLIPALFTVLRLPLNAVSEALELTGLLGVRIFFGLSGFLITSRMLMEEDAGGKIDLAGFYIRRFFRIMPAAFTMLSIVGILSILGILHISLSRWLSQLLFLANYSPAPTSYFVGHFWSLSIEEHFYFIWPSMLVVFAQKRRPTISLFAALCIAFWRALDWKFHITNSNPADFWARTDIQGDFLIWGGIIALLANNAKWKLALKHLVTSRTTQGFLTFILASSTFVSFAGWKTHFALLTVVAIAIPLAILTTLWSPQSLPARCLENRFARWLGRLSYSLYLWQQLFICPPELVAGQLRIVQTLPFNIFSAFALAVASRYLVEIPCISIGRRIAHNRKSYRM